MGCTCTKVKLRRFSQVGQKPEVVPVTEPELSDNQKAVIRNNWQILKLYVANVGVITFVSLFESHPNLKENFLEFKGKDVTDLKQNGLLRAHALRMMATVDKCISRLDEPLKLSRIMTELGQHHRRYNVQPEYIQYMVPAFIQAIKPHLENFWSEDVATAWRMLFRLMVFHMSVGIRTGDDRPLSSRVKD